MDTCGLSTTAPPLVPFEAFSLGVFVLLIP